jgi:hypothetical protein
LLFQLFFAKVPPTALASEVELLFGSFGKLAEVNLFRAWAGAKHSKVSKETGVRASKPLCVQAYLQAVVGATDHACSCVA